MENNDIRIKGIKQVIQMLLNTTTNHKNITFDFGIKKELDDNLMSPIPSYMQRLYNKEVNFIVELIEAKTVSGLPLFLLRGTSYYDNHITYKEINLSKTLADAEDVMDMIAFCIHGAQSTDFSNGVDEASMLLAKAYLIIVESIKEYNKALTKEKKLIEYILKRMSKESNEESRRKVLFNYEKESEGILNISEGELIHKDSYNPNDSRYDDCDILFLLEDVAGNRAGMSILKKKDGKFILNSGTVIASKPLVMSSIWDTANKDTMNNVYCLLNGKENFALEAHHENLFNAFLLGLSFIREREKRKFDFVKDISNELKEEIYEKFKKVLDGHSATRDKRVAVRFLNSNFITFNNDINSTNLIDDNDIVLFIALDNLVDNIPTCIVSRGQNDIINRVGISFNGANTSMGIPYLIHDTITRFNGSQDEIPHSEIQELTSLFHDKLIEGELALKDNIYSVLAQILKYNQI